MKCTKVALALALSFSSYNAIANNNEQGDITINAFLESTGVGTSAQYRFLDDWSARVELAQQNNIDSSRYGVDALYHIDNSPVYAFAGVKQIDTLDVDTLANVGIGATQKINNNWGLLLETAWYEGISDSFTEVTMKLGVSYTFGGTNKTARRPAASPNLNDTVKDSDNDGVSNDIDICPNTPIEDAVDIQGCSRYEDRKVSISLLVNFPNNESNIQSQYFSNISKVAQYLNDNPEAELSIEGHASTVGEANYNLALSKRRANAVAAILTQRYGISPNRVKTIGHGDSKPVNSSNTDEAHAQNRRVEIFNTTNISVKVKRVDNNTKAFSQ
jgi:OOP family OmpA-OmpF porin